MYKRINTLRENEWSECLLRALLSIAIVKIFGKDNRGNHSQYSVIPENYPKSRFRE